MPKLLCILGLLGLTLAGLVVGAEETRPADASRAARGKAVVRQGAADEPSRVIPVAQKKPRKKGAHRKEEPGASEKSKLAPSADGDGAGPKFSRDIAPILVGNCLDCHNERAMAKNGKLDLTSFERIQKGGADGAIIVAGKPEESHLYRRLTGDETPRMPRGGNRQLSEGAIAKVGEWIKAGGRLDAGIDPKAPLSSYASTAEQLRSAELAKLPLSERDKRVEAKGRERWKKGNAKATPEVISGKSFMMFGQLPKERASATLKALEEPYAQVRALVAPSAGGESPVKVGVYVFNERTSYVEFVRTVEGREADRAEQGTANLGDPEPYVAVLDPLGGRPEPPSAPRRKGRGKRSDDGLAGSERSVAGVIADSLAAGVVRREGPKAPHWLALGIGSYYGARVDPRSAETQRLRQAALEQFRLGWVSKANDALGGGTRPELVRAVGFAIVEALATSPQTRPYFPAFVRGMLAGGETLDDTLQQVFGMTREQFLDGTGQYVMTSYGS